MIIYYNNLHLDSVAVGLYGVIVYNLLHLVLSEDAVDWVLIGLVKHASIDFLELGHYFSPFERGGIRPLFIAEGALFAFIGRGLFQLPVVSGSVFFTGFIIHFVVAQSIADPQQTAQNGLILFGKTLGLE